MDLDVLRNPMMAVDWEADLREEMLAPIVSETGNARDQALGRGNERLLEGCAWVW